LAAREREVRAGLVARGLARARPAASGREHELRSRERSVVLSERPVRA
jgi:hypothetical protein